MSDLHPTSPLSREDRLAAVLHLLAYLEAVEEVVPPYPEHVSDLVREIDTVLAVSHESYRAAALRYVVLGLNGSSRVERDRALAALKLPTKRLVRAIHVAISRCQASARARGLAVEVSELRAQVAKFKARKLELLDDRMHLRQQRDLLHRVLQSCDAWGNFHCADRDVRLLAPWTADAPPSEALGVLLWERPPMGPAWPEPMDEEGLAEGWCSECMTDLRPHGPDTRPTDDDTAREWVCPKCEHTEPGAPCDGPEPQATS